MKRKVRSRILIALNAAGLACLAVFGIIYLARDTAVRDPGTMIPMTGWEAAGIALTVGFFPLSAVNLLAFLFLGKERNSRLLRLLFLIPSLACLGLAVHFWGFSLLSDFPSADAVPIVRVLYAESGSQRENAVLLYGDGGMEKLKDPFEPDQTAVLTFTWDRFTSEIRDGRVENTLTDPRGVDREGTPASADETVQALLRALCSGIGHEIMEVKVFEKDRHYFAAVKTNVNWQDPCLFYQYQPDTGSLLLLYRWDRVDITGIALPVRP